MQEDSTTEFKREYIDDIKYAVIAFVNTEGGKIYVGLRDDGTVYGVQDVDESLQRISNLIRGAIRPDPSMFVKLTVLKMDDKSVIEISVQRGTARPYYLAGKGIRPEGVYVRLGATSVPASETAILSMIRETSGDRYEDACSINQALTFGYATKYFEKKGVLFGHEQHKTLGIVNADGLYTNLGYLLSDQCAHTIKLAVFQDDDKMIFRDRKELTGSILQQFDEACVYLNRYNRLHAEFKGFSRIDNQDYPVEALREALLNAIVHRDYSLSASTLISIFEDRCEIVSVGGLVRGITYDDILLGISVLRSPHLANVFYRLELIEAYGTGVLKINRAYKNNFRKPQIQTTNNAFKITLPNTNFGESARQDTAMSSREEQVLLFIKEKGRVTRLDVQTYLKMSQSATILLLRKLLDGNFIVKQGNGRMSTYRVL